MTSNAETTSGPTKTRKPRVCDQTRIKLREEFVAELEAERKFNSLTARLGRLWITILVLLGVKRDDDRKSVWERLGNRIDDAMQERKLKQRQKAMQVLRLDPATVESLPLGGEEESTNAERYWSGKPVVGILLIIVLLAVVSVSACTTLLTRSETRVKQPNTAPQASVPTTAPVEAVADFTISMPRRDGHRLNADGVEKRGDAEAFRAQIAQQAMHDPLTLYLYYQASPLGRTQPLESEAVLAKDGRIENGNVYSKVGIEAYNKWLVFWETADITAVKEIKFQGANTGVNGTTTTQSNGVGGKDKSGYDIAYRDVNDQKSDEHSALNRCTQPTARKRVPGVPKGPTDNPKDPSKDVGANPGVAAWKKDNTGGNAANGHTVTNEDGATHPNGLQRDPAADAAAAAAKAEAAAAAAQAAHEAAVTAAAANVDSSQNHTATTDGNGGW